MLTSKRFNPENKSYSMTIPADELAAFEEKCNLVKEKIIKAQQAKPPVFEPGDSSLDIDDFEQIKSLIENEPNFKINMSLNRRRASLFLVCCYFCSKPDIIEYVLNCGSEINRVDLYGYNALMTLTLNEVMSETDKLPLVKLFIEKGIDIDWNNYEGDTPLTLALETMQLDIAGILIDAGALILRDC